MKPQKEVTKQINAEREFKIAQRECKNEFGKVLDSNILDEESLCLVLSEIEEE
jgi:hypothetical protein